MRSSEQNFQDQYLYNLMKQETSNISSMNQSDFGMINHTNGFNNLFVPRKNSIIIIDEDDDKENNRENENKPVFDENFITEINEFQYFLDSFHKNLEQGLERCGGHVHSNSKKIRKMEGPEKPSWNCGKSQTDRYNYTSVLGFS